jgi:hypothetical protein
MSVLKDLGISQEILTPGELDKLQGVLSDRINDYELLPALIAYEVSRIVNDEKNMEYYKFRVMGILGIK